MAERKLPVVYVAFDQSDDVAVASRLLSVACTEKTPLCHKYVPEPGTCATCKSYSQARAHAYDPDWMIQDCENSKGLSAPEPQDWCCHHDPKGDPHA